MQIWQKLMHLEHENGLKPHFSPFLALIGPILGPTNFFQHFDHHQLLDIITPRHNVHNQQKLMQFEHDNGQKPHFGPFLALIGPILGPANFFQHFDHH